MEKRDNFNLKAEMAWWPIRYGEAAPWEVPVEVVPAASVERTDRETIAEATEVELGTAGEAAKAVALIPPQDWLLVPVEMELPTSLLLLDHEKLKRAVSIKFTACQYSPP